MLNQGTKAGNIKLVLLQRIIFYYELP
jgi:hypothetical protein